MISDAASLSPHTGNNWQFSFNVKFYPPDPSLLTEDITRYTTLISMDCCLSFFKF